MSYPKILIVKFSRENYLDLKRRFDKDAFGIAKCIREITRGSVMCHYLTANDLIYDQMNTLYNTLNPNSVFESKP